MDTTYLRMIDFHVPSGDEILKIKKLQRKRRIQSFFKRMAMVFIIVGIACIFQTIARQTVPTRFSQKSTLEKLYIIGLVVFLGVNLISWIELLIEDKILFRMKKAEVAYVRVKKKMVCEKINWYASPERILICENVIPQEEKEEDKFFYQESEEKQLKEKSSFILDKIIVHGVFAFSNISEWDMVYIERIEHDGKYRYHYVA